jgi:tRNA-dihydrouridine synthase B
VGNVPVYGNLILSPMDGVTDLPFRVLTRRLGSAMSYTEFINAIDVVYNHPFLEERLAYFEEERPVVFQIFDDDPDRMVKAAVTLMARRPDILDVNMGCPAKTVAGRGAGSALLRDPKKVQDIIRKLSGVLPIPVTAKIRLGWDDKSRNYLEIAKIIEGEGGKLVAVHGRTRMQAYSGNADWDAIAEIKQVVKIPVVGNGDVRTVADCQRLIQHTSCDGVMIGRAALENPWIFSGINRDEVTPDTLLQTMNQQLDMMIGLHSQRGLILFRKFVKKYFKPYSISPDKIKEIVTCEDERQFRRLIQQALAAA